MNVGGVESSGYISIPQEKGDKVKGTWKLPGDGEELRVTLQKDRTLGDKFRALFSGKVYVKLPAGAAVDFAYIAISKKEWQQLLGTTTKPGAVFAKYMEMKPIVVQFDTQENERVFSRLGSTAQDLLDAAKETGFSARQVTVGEEQKVAVCKKTEHGFTISLLNSGDDAIFEGTGIKVSGDIARFYSDIASMMKHPGNLVRADDKGLYRASCQKNGERFSIDVYSGLYDESVLNIDRPYIKEKFPETSTFAAMFGRTTSEIDVNGEKKTVVAERTEGKTFNIRIVRDTIDEGVSLEAQKEIKKIYDAVAKEAKEKGVATRVITVDGEHKVAVFTKAADGRFHIGVKECNVTATATFSRGDRPLVLSLISGADEKGFSFASRKATEGDQEIFLGCVKSKEGDFRIESTKIRSNLLPAVKEEVSSRLPRLLNTLATSPHPKVNEFFTADGTLYSVICTKNEETQEIETTILEESQNLERAFGKEAADHIADVVKEKFSDLATIANAALVGKTIEKGSRRLNFELKGKTYSIKCRQEPDGMYSLESSKQLGFGTTKSILKTLELAPGMMARVSGKVRKDVIRTKEKAAETEAIEEAKLLGLGGEAVTRLIQEKKRTARLLISADLRKEYENMKLFDGNPYIVQCTRIMNKEHVVGLESIELTREGDIEECDRGSADALVASPPKDLAEYMERVSLGRDWALGMAAIHDKGFVHNDVKPANFMIKTGDDEKLHGKVGDLGSLAKDGDSPPGYTFFYLAPEFNREAGKQVGTKQNDVWALGMSLLEVMHGPQNELKMQILRDAQNGYKKVEELQRKLSGTGDPMDKAIASMLEKDPAKRPSMQEIANQLAEILPST